MSTESRDLRGGLDLVFVYEWLGSDRVSESVSFLVVISAGIIVLQRSQCIDYKFSEVRHALHPGGPAVPGERVSVSARVHL